MNQDMQRAGFVDCIQIANTLQGSIWSATHQISNNKVVIKVTEKYLHSKSMVMMKLNGVQRKCKVNENILIEKDILKHLTTDKHCPNSIVKYIGFFTGEFHYYLVMEHGGSSFFDFVFKVHQFISTRNVEILEWHRLVKVLFKQMIESVEYIHSHNICHFDISLENFCLNDIKITPYKDGTFKRIKFLHDDVEVKLCDFGLANAFERGSVCHSNKYCGKMCYKCPEIAARKTLFNAKSNDVFCLGVCLFMMITGTHPWREATESDERFRYIRNGHLLQLLTVWNRSHFVNKELLDLFNKIFQYEDKRINLEQLKQHSWLQ
eukprot:246604_1